MSAIAGAPDPIEKPPLPNGGKLERYTPRTQNSALLLTASADVPSVGVTGDSTLDRQADE